MILSEKRFQTVDCLDIRNMSLTDSEVIFRIGDPLKTSTVRHHLQEIGFSAFPDDDRLCIVAAIKTYIQFTSNLRLRSDQTKLLLITRKPYGPASKPTVTRWVKDVLKASGISEEFFTAYSVRSASTSKVFKKGMAWESIRKAIGWRRESTFSKHYNKTVLPVGCFGQTILHSYTGTG